MVFEECAREVPKVKIQPAMAFLGSARQYHGAAEQLFEQRREFYHPVYFLYFHTVELALKAFLFSCNVKPKGGHSLTTLYEDCRKHGLIIGPYDQFDIGNIVSLLESGNRSQGFRYITQTSRSLPDFSWTREVVGELMEAVARHLGVDLKQKPVPGVAVRFDMVFSRPVPKA
jgi:hypothetical protein